MNTYKNITFAKGYNKSFADFKEDFASAEVFKNMMPDVREVELIKAYNIATEGKYIEVISEKELKNGDTTKPTRSSKKDNTEQA
jgi:hypothetical protein